jgi:glycosyl transferase family 25
MENIDAILYINLEHRTDRNEHILSEINKICIDSTKIHRIDAIRKELGALGCGLSHIKALEYALEHLEWKNILILEDDFTFKTNNKDEIINDIDTLLTYSENINIGLLSSNLKHLKCDDTANVKIKKVEFSQTASAYIIKKEYIPILLNNFKEAVENMKNCGVKHENCIDQYWGKLQTSGNWYLIYPPIGYQYDSFSDIENKYVSYNC